MDFTNFETVSLIQLASPLNSKKIYKTQLKNLTASPTSQAHFDNHYKTDQVYWPEIYSLPFQCTIESKLRSFQFKMNHNIVFTNERLFRYNMVASNLCTFCKGDVETVDHLFVSCIYVKLLWDKIVSELLLPYGIHNIPTENVILGFYKDEQNGGQSLPNHIIFSATYFIYKCKLMQKIPNWYDFKFKLKDLEYIERQIAMRKGKLDHHNRKWDPLAIFW